MTVGGVLCSISCFYCFYTLMYLRIDVYVICCTSNLITARGDHHPDWGEQQAEKYIMETNSPAIFPSE